MDIRRNIALYIGLKKLFGEVGFGPLVINGKIFKISVRFVTFLTNTGKNNILIK